MGCRRGRHAGHVHQKWRCTRVRNLTSLDAAARSDLSRRFRYTTTLREAFLRDGIASLKVLDGRGWIAGSAANAFVANHDTERVRPFPYRRFVDDTLRRTRYPSTLTRRRTRTHWPPSSPCMSQYPHSFRNGSSLLFCFASPSAHPYGMPSVLSSYSNFYNTDAGGPNGGTS